MKAHKHRAEVIEVYEEQGKSAVRMSSGRVECVAGTWPVGTRGHADFVMTPQTGRWAFVPMKTKQTK